MVEKQKEKVSASEEAVSMFLGLAIVIAIIAIVFNYFQRRKGDVEVPGTVSEVVGSPTPINLGTNGEKTVSDDEHIVKKGESLWLIAAYYYGNGDYWTNLVTANNIKNPNVISAGQKLILPKNVKNLDAEETYVVTKGDHLWKIALEKYGDGFAWTKIWQANRGKIGDPDILAVNTVLTIPK
ncbi:MAG: LysM peptidoglycan-binding domain-containing protein [Candidatus Shapirobacteria bacterium]|jgi:nucleoid-associated protein YgaU